MIEVSRKRLLVAVVSLALSISLFIPSGRAYNKVLAAGDVITVDINQSEGVSGEGIHSVSDTLYGVFFEDINYGADGGLNAEMVVNNSFQFSYIPYSTATKTIVYDRLRYWDESTDNSSVRTLEAGTESALRMSEINDSYAVLNIKTNVAGEEYQLINHGYQGGDMRSEDDSLKLPALSDEPAMAIVKNGQYRFSFYYDTSSYFASDAEDNYRGAIDAYIRHPSGLPLTNVLTFEVGTNGWTKVSGVFTANGEAWDRGFAMARNHYNQVSCLGSLVLKFKGIGRLNLDFFSLIDVNAWGMDDHRYSGGKLRRDLVEAIEGMNPSFFRFPGGCVAEGDGSWENVYNWENTIGKIEDRKGTPNTWEYYQSYGVGFYEYFLLCEDLAMKPLPVVSVGLICQGRMGETGALMVSYEDSLRFQREVVDRIAHLIFYALGSPNSSDATEREWASKRVSAGHTETFDLEYIGIGNENWGDVYWDNFDACLAALKSYSYGGRRVNLLEQFGSIAVITTTGVAGGTGSLYDSGTKNNNYIFHDAWERIDERALADPDTLYITDEHYYVEPSWMTNANNLKRYDNNNGFSTDLSTATSSVGREYNRESAKVFVGEYSANYYNNAGNASKFNTMHTAVAEAAFMTQLEKNSDLVVMASYAPLFGRAANTKWDVDCIFFNPLNHMLTPNYFVQQMFGMYIGDTYIPDKSFSSTSVVQSITIDSEKKEVYVKAVNYSSSTAANLSIDLSSIKDINSSYKKITLSGGANDKNTIDPYSGAATYNVAPVTTNGTLTISGSGETLSATTSFTAPANSVNVFVFSYGSKADNADVEVKIFGSAVEVSEYESGKDSSINVVNVGYGDLRVPRLDVSTLDRAATFQIDYAESLEDITTLTVTPASGSLDAAKVYKFAYVIADAPVISVKSAKIATISIFDAYKLDYDISAGSALVTVSGGRFYESTGQFIALAAGTYTITITSELEPSVSEVVSVTVIQEANTGAADGSTGDNGGCQSAASMLTVAAALLVLGSKRFIMR